MKLYTVLDIELKRLTSPVMLRNDKDATRMFTRMLKEDAFNGCPVEFYCLGDFDDEDLVSPFRPYPSLKRLYLDANVECDVDSSEEA